MKRRCSKEPTAACGDTFRSRGAADLAYFAWHRSQAYRLGRPVPPMASRPCRVRSPGGRGGFKAAAANSRVYPLLRVFAFGFLAVAGGITIMRAARR